MQTPARTQSQLLSRISRQYDVVTEPRQVGRVTLNFTRVRDPDRVLDQVVEACDRRERTTGVREQNPQHLPYWAELWESAHGVGEVLAAGPDLAGARVLDLGCGMGLAGSVAAALGGRVIFADLESPALLFARFNSLPWAPRVACRRLDWQRDRLGQQFDVILGADILYERAQWEFLDAFWQAHLARGGYLLLGEPGRLTGDTFLTWAPARGWLIDRQDLKVPGRDAPVRALRLVRAAG